MASVVRPSEIATRFHTVRRSLLVGQLAIAAAIGAVMLVASILLLAVLDFYFELPLIARWIGLALVLIASVSMLGLMIYQAVRNGASHRAVARMEKHFEPLGQRLRTTLDVAKGKDAEAPLYCALANQTKERCDAVGLESIIPKKVASYWSLGAMVLLCMASISSMPAGTWSLAMKRALGMNQPYTLLSVEPGNLRVNAGEPTRATLVVQGRTQLDVSLRLRKADDPNAEWTQVAVERGDSHDPSSAKTFGWIPKLKESVDYQFLTSKGETAIYRLDIRYPIDVETMQFTVHRPEYTGLEDRVFESSDITVLEGSKVGLTLHTSGKLDHVHLTTTSIGTSQTARHILAPTNSSQTDWQIQVDAVDSIRWSIEGEAEDGTPLAPVQGWVRVKPDRPPRLRWVSPTEPTSVHVLAEVPLRVRIDDDYGLREAGIQFEISGDNPHTLTTFQADKESIGSEASLIQLLEEILPLENVELSEKDYIAYYAYAVDNRPGQPQRIESDWRYIDIRSLRTSIKIDDSAPDSEEEERSNLANRTLDSLEELIEQQRYLINRTRVLSRMRTEELSSRLGLLDRHTIRQSELASKTKLLADGLERNLAADKADDLDAFRQAEASMIQATDALNLLEFDVGLAHQKDAQRSLVEARTKLQESVTLNPRPGRGGGMGRFNRMLRSRMGFRGFPNRPRREAPRPLGARLWAAAVEQTMIGSLFAVEQNKAKAASTILDSVASKDDAAIGEEPGLDGSIERLTAVERQLKLLEEVGKIGDELGRQAWVTPLITSRNESIVKSIDETSGLMSTATPSVSDIQRDAGRISAALQELALHVESINPREPIARISGTRNLIVSLATLEKGLVDAVTTNSTVEEIVRDQRIAAAAESVLQRTLTLKEVIASAADARDAESQRFADAIAEWLIQEPLLDQVDASEIASQQVLDSNPKLPALVAGNRQRSDRIVELVRMAQSLDLINRQMVSPELERLRQIESEGARLARQSAPNNAENPPNDPNTQTVSANDVRDFVEQLQSVALNEAAEQLNQAIDESGQFPRNAIGTAGDSLAQAISKANQEVQKRIRELILSEVAAERDTPIPPQYIPSVNDYYRAVFGEEPKL